ncbi:hypothetical protein [Streptomyces sp. KL116D]|uniref:hypothetical protein n=1 Tax=Streptomyces sp. KL116D TaxID=3045152 RepID=UPI00355643CB
MQRRSGEPRARHRREDTASGFTARADPDTAPIFGDGAGAVVLEAGRPTARARERSTSAATAPAGEYLHVPAGCTADPRTGRCHCRNRPTCGWKAANTVAGTRCAA